MLPFSFIYVLQFLFFAFFLIKWIFTTTSSTTSSLPPSPPKLPIIGNLHQLGLYPYRSLHSLANRYGPLMLLHFGRKPVLIVSSADAASEIMKTHDIIFSNRPNYSIAGKLLYSRQDVSTAPYGEYWRQMRSICVLHLLSNSRVQSFRKVREEEMALFIKKIESSASGSLNLSEMFASMTNDVICRAAFGRKYGGGSIGGRSFKEMLVEFMGLLGNFDVGDFIPWLSWVNIVNGVDAKAEKISAEFDKFLEEIIEDHLHGKKKSDGEEDQKDFVDVLIDIQKNNITGFSISRINIKALILDMFAAGTDTTYIVLDWAMTELLRHPRVMKELQNEARRVANGKLDIKEEDLDKMHYLKAVLKEILRLHPPIPLLVPRESSQDVKVKGYDIPAGTIVVTNAWTIGRDPATWDEPDEFKPERFLNKNSIDFIRHEFQLLPFGAGRRGCPGILFSMRTIELLLANLVHKFDWSLPDGRRAEDLDMSQCTGLAIHRKVPLLAVATTRGL